MFVRWFVDSIRSIANGQLCCDSDTRSIKAAHQVRRNLVRPGVPRSSSSRREGERSSTTTRPIQTNADVDVCTLESEYVNGRTDVHRTKTYKIGLIAFGKPGTCKCCRRFATIDSRLRPHSDSGSATVQLCNWQGIAHRMQRKKDGERNAVPHPPKLK